MPRYRLSTLAHEDLQGIRNYTEKRWGISQTYGYISNLKECLLSLSANPNLGRACDSIHKDYRRFEHGKHVIFYKPDTTGIFVSRILHQSMLPRRHTL